MDQSEERNVCSFPLIGQSDATPFQGVSFGTQPGMRALGTFPLYYRDIHIGILFFSTLAILTLKLCAFIAWDHQGRVGNPQVRATLKLRLI